MNLYFRPLLTLCWFCLALSAPGCNHSSQPSDANLTVSGKTYLRGSIDPLPGVTVKCAGLSSISGADGMYQLVGVPKGIQIFTAERADCYPLSDTITVNGDMRHDVLLTLKPLKTCRVWGYVSNALDGPIEGATVRLKDSVVFSDASGRYELPPLSYGSDTLFVSRNNYRLSATVVTLDSSEKQINVSLLRREIITMKVTEDAHVDESRPADNFGASSVLLLSSNTTTQTGNQKNIYIKWDFPEILRDERKPVNIAGIQLILSAPVLSSSVQTYSVTSSWSATSITYVAQPARGALLETTTTGAFDGLYWYVLTTASVNQLIADWKSNRPFYGIVIRGGPSSGTPATFDSSEGLNHPRLLLVLQY